MKKNSKSHANEYEIDIQNPFAKSRNIQVTEDPERNLVVLRIYGELDEPEEYVDEITKLDLLAKNYDIVEISLNSPGGSLNTAVDLASIINKYQYVITIGKGTIASAAFMIWTMGDIRVVTNYSMYMAHRESYGMYGKTSEHRDAADTFGKVYEEMFNECFGDLLTKKEKRIAERSEAWISYKDLVARDRVISFDEYIDPANPYSVMDAYVSQDGKMFMYDMETDAYRNINVTFGDELISDMTDYLYGITEISKMLITKSQKPKKVKKSSEKKKDKKNVKSKKKKQKKEIT
jgi:ATP-dependent protease ClpP protease subunit